MERWNVSWTPTILVVGPDGREHYRIEGFLDVPELLAHLLLGLGQAAFAAKDYATSEKRFEEVLERFPDTSVAPEAQYWRGVSRYRISQNPAALAETAAAFTERYGDSVWAKKASVWGAAPQAGQTAEVASTQSARASS
jgi:tetratricopeptide (TPR) repeat protein